MSVEQNKAIIRRFIEECLNARNAGLIDEVYAANYVGHDPERPQPRGIQDMHATMTVMLGKVFPDARYSIESLTAEGDRVVWHWMFRATHQGEFQGVPPTGKSVAFGGVNILRMVNGKVVEDWVYRDTMGMMRQLGLMPTPK